MIRTPLLAAVAALALAGCSGATSSPATVTVTPAPSTTAPTSAPTSAPSSSSAWTRLGKAAGECGVTAAPDAKVVSLAVPTLDRWDDFGCMGVTLAVPKTVANRIDSTTSGARGSAAWPGYELTWSRNGGTYVFIFDEQ